MRFIPTRIHGRVDYAMGLVLIVAPWILGFGGNNPQTWIPTVLGIGGTAYSLCTRYEWGVTPMLGMPLHLGLDFMSGLLLAVSPWLFGFAHVVWGPHLVLGLVEMGMALMTQTVPAELGTRRSMPATRGF